MAPVNAQVVNFVINNQNTFSVVVYYNHVTDIIPAGESREYSTTGNYYVAQVGREAAAAANFADVFLVVSFNSGGGSITTSPGDIRGHFAVTANLV